MTTTVEPTVITEPGVYDIPDDVYHDDPVPEGSLSSSGARKLMPPSCPAKFKYDRDHGETHKAVFDFGHAAHKLVLGSGPELVQIDYADWRTSKAREERDKAYAAGKVPLLVPQFEQVQGMAAAIREHPIASVLFDPEHGRPEQSLFWRHRSGVMLRARLDWMPEPAFGEPFKIVDYKSAASAEPAKLAKVIADLGYHMQDAFYRAGVQALGLADDPGFVLVVQEKTAPYLITVVEPDQTAVQWARVLNERAIDVYRRCREADHWPGYTDRITPVSLPHWTVRSYEDARDAGDFEVGL